MSPLYWVGLPLMLMVLRVVARTAVSPLGRLGVVVEVNDRVLPQRGQLGVDGVDVRLAQGVAGQVDLPERVRTRALSTRPPSRRTVPPGTRLMAKLGKALATGS